MYNRSYKYLLENKFIYPKQFGFQFAVIKFADHTFEAFEKNLY